MNFIIENITFKIDNNNKIYINNTQINHPEKILLCLRLFLQSQNKVLSKDQLMEHLWGEVVVSDDSLFKVIQEIRSIFKKNGLSGSTITNVYGKGYKVQPQIRLSVEKNGSIHKAFIASSLILIALIGAAYLMRDDTKNQISPQEFQHIVASINSKFTNKTINLDKFSITDQSNAHDKTRIAYLQGLIDYKKGDYSNSIKHLNSALHLFEKSEPIPVMADTYLLLSKIYIYKNDKELLKDYLNKADYYYEKMNDNKGLVSTKISRARYHQTLNQYPQSIELLNQVLNDAKDSGDQYNQMRAYANLAYSHQQTNNPDQYKLALEQSLQLALEIPNGSYAALAYGSLVSVYLDDAEYKKAMQFAQNTLKYAIAENNTNTFQQGYSSFYNILGYLGHDVLAERHLNYAIDLQEKFNPEGRLIEAEINLAILKISQGKYGEAHKIFIDLLNLETTDNEIHRIQSWMSLNDYYRKDNISAYTLAKTCLDFPDNKHKLIAYLALSLSSNELERIDEAINAFAQAEKLADPNGLSEYPYYLNTALLFYSGIIEDKEKYQLHMQLKRAFNQKLNSIKKQTIPDESILKELNDHINNI